MKLFTLTELERMRNLNDNLIIYLKMKSADGKPERQELRNKLFELSQEINNILYNPELEYRQELDIKEYDRIAKEEFNK